MCLLLFLNSFAFSIKFLSTNHFLDRKKICERWKSNWSRRQERIKRGPIYDIYLYTGIGIIFNIILYYIGTVIFQYSVFDIILLLKAHIHNIIIHYSLLIFVIDVQMNIIYNKYNIYIYTYNFEWWKVN